MFKRISAFLLIAFTLIVLPIFALAADVPDGDPLATLLALIVNFKGMAPLAIGMALIIIATQAVKKFFPTFTYNRLIVAVLTVAYTIILSLTNGLSLLQSLIAALITGGGAVAIYEAIKGVGTAAFGPPKAKR